ncbi:MAG: cytochrome c oxidase assembly protein [Sphingomonadales bacterium]
MGGRRARNRGTAIVLGLTVVAMIGLSYAAVPLYRLFCQVTGYGGTTQVAQASPDRIYDRAIKIRFNADKARDLPWVFKPAQKEVTVQVGENALAYYHAQNRGVERITGTAIYNVTPLKAGPYFSKIDCFCFTEQTLEPGQTAELPVSFFVDPEILDDPDLDDVGTITLSYSFYRQTEADGEPTVAHAGILADANNTKSR